MFPRLEWRSYVPDAQQKPQFLPRPPQAGHHRAGGTMQNIGDLVITQAFKFAQHDNLAVLDRELLHSGTHAVALYPGYIRSIWIVAGARPTNGVFLLLVGPFHELRTPLWPSNSRSTITARYWTGSCCTAARTLSRSTLVTYEAYGSSPERDRVRAAVQ